MLCRIVHRADRSYLSLHIWYQDLGMCCHARLMLNCCLGILHLSPQRAAAPAMSSQLHHVLKLHGIPMHSNPHLFSFWGLPRRAASAGRLCQRPNCHTVLLIIPFQNNSYRCLRPVHTQEMSSKPKPKRAVQEPRPSARYVSLTESRNDY
jgi:hypothetical protein